MVMFEYQNIGTRFYQIQFSKCYPRLKICRNTNNLIEIEAGKDQKMIIEIEPSLRDVCTLVIRSLLNRCPVEDLVDDDSGNPTSNDTDNKQDADRVENISILDSSANEASFDASQSHNSVADLSVECSYEVEEVVEEVKTELPTVSVNSRIEDKPKTNIRRQKLATGKKKKKAQQEAKAEKIELKDDNTEKENKDGAKNPFRDFLDNLSDRSRGIAKNIIKERDGLITKIHSVTTPRHKTIMVDSDVQTDYELMVNDKQGNYMDDVMKISQLSQELSKQNKYLTTAEDKISELQTQLSEANDKINDMNDRIRHLDDMVAAHRENDKKVAEDIAQNASRMSFLEVENGILNHEKQRILSRCPNGISDLSDVEVMHKDEYKLWKNGYSSYKVMCKSFKSIEQKCMFFNDKYMLSKYDNKQKVLLSQRKTKNVQSKDIKLENQQLLDRVKQLETDYQNEVTLRESIEAERNLLKKTQVSQARDIDKLRKQLLNIQKGNSCLASSLFVDHDVQLQKCNSLQEYNIDKHDNGNNNIDDNDLFATPKSLKADLDNIKPDDLYDLRMGESSYSINQEDSVLEDQVSKNHALRAEIEDYRQRLMESEQVFVHYKRVLKDEIGKNNELKRQIHRMRLIEEYGYDDSRSVLELENKIEDLRTLLQEKSIALAAQMDINKQLMLKMVDHNN